ncbi:MAG TPA: S26 family signal peptidase [Patescibacteria group bacterium]|nr:S26 family signal peptidase [Patescibacteria group bacterium]
MVFLQKFRVIGHSMEPLIIAGQEILVSSLPYLFFKPKVGDIIAFSLAKKDLSNFIVKRIKEVAGDKFLVQGDNKDDSKDFGWVEKKRIVGKVIYP